MIKTFSKLTEREKKIGYAVIGLLVVLMVYHGVWRPLANKFSSLNDEIFSMQMKLRKAKIFLRQKEEITEEIKKYPNLQQLDARKDEEEIASLLKFIEEQARTASVNLSDVKPQQVSGDKVSKRYVVELTGESGIKELIQFIYNLQYSAQMLKVEKVDMIPKEEGSTTLKTSLMVTRVVVK